MISNFKDKVAVLTGGASGFGLEMARIGVARGMRVVLVDVQQDALDAAVKELTAAGGQVMARKVDVANPQAMEALAAEVKATWGAPNLVFNNAGVSTGGLIWENSVADWEWVLGVNLWGVIHGVRVFTPMMLEAAKTQPGYEGHIVNTASMAGLVTMPNMGVYNVSKHAVVAFTETLYQDLQLVTDHISASVLCPYFVPTGIDKSDRNRPDKDAQLSKSQLLKKELTSSAVSKGKVSAADIARNVFEATEHNHFYIYSHPHALASVQQRADAIVNRTQPPNPYAAKPEIGEMLRKAFRVAYE
ncbi:hypothetical protein CCO03_10515 [Comamonas serinivorans]|uniref:Short-chain dehydrogenase n=1 Tax=Comamonas serinivorans TaxID=1082851 RepID=A0A1Y0EN51_9BURK|nr:SDR family oxidoreductase [Comamonas serinivorans]ARU05065.1 hypothetical protein CCO03_10515 [Comamonas serinivorans]